MQEAAISGPQGSAIDPDTVCIGCGMDSSPDTMVICDSCEQGLHTACFGMLAVPDTDPWYCRGCTVLQQLAVGHQIITESPQNLHPGGTSAQPHHTQGLYLATIVSLGQVQKDATGCNRQVRLQSSLAPLPGSVCFYSKTQPFQSLQHVPQQSLKLSELLLQRPGASEVDITLASSRYGMFGTAAASAGLSSEAWLAGLDCAGEALRILAGSPRQAFICSSIGRSSSNTAAARSAESNRSQMAQQEQAGAVSSSRVCIGCNTSTSGKPMQHCPVCRQWSCSTPCGVSAGLVAACLQGRPQRQGAGQRWSCPNPHCGEHAVAATMTAPSSGPRRCKPQLPPAAAAPAPVHSSDSPLAQQQPSPGLVGPSHVQAPAMFPPGLGMTLPQPVYRTQHHADIPSHRTTPYTQQHRLHTHTTCRTGCCQDHHTSCCSLAAQGCGACLLRSHLCPHHLHQPPWPTHLCGRCQA